MKLPTRSRPSGSRLVVTTTPATMAKTGQRQRASWFNRAAYFPDTTAKLRRVVAQRCRMMSGSMMRRTEDASTPPSA